MSALYLLLPLGLLLAAMAVAWFVWSVRSGQWDDLDSPPLRAIFGDEELDTGRESNNNGDADPETDGKE